jgi:Aerotolerance regulator N-terminal/von Willebrand factor type A domain
MLSFLSPWFLLGAVTAAVPIVLHLLKREPEPRVRFSAVKFLKLAPVEHSEKRRIRELLLLALRVAALILLALTFARPFIASGAAIGNAHATVIALDTSYSMSAPGAFERARQLAREAIEHTPAGELVGVVTFADTAQMVTKPAIDRVLALAAVDVAKPGFGATRYRGALNTAAEALGGRRGSIVVVTDLQESGWDAGNNAAVPESVRIEIADVGSPPSDLAVTTIRADGDRITASVRNTGDTAREALVRLVLDGRRIADTRARIGPHAISEVMFAGAARSATAAVEVDDPAGIQADNVRYLILGRSITSTILVVTDSGALDREAFYVQQALAADAGDKRSYQTIGASPAQVSVWDAARLSTNLAIVLLSTRGLERRGREALAASVGKGVGILIAAGPDVDGEVVGDVLGRETPLRLVTNGDPKPVEHTLAPPDGRHPVFQSFGGRAATLGLVRFRRVARIDGTGCQGVARFTTGEFALIECAVGDGRALVLASDLDNKWNDFPLHASFVPFMHEAIRYLGGSRHRVEDYLVADVPAGVPAVPGIVSVPEPAGAERPSRSIAVNVDARESDPARVSVAEFQQAVARVKDAGVSAAPAERSQQEDRQQFWRYSLMLMIGVLAIEGLVASRTA